MGLSMLQRKPDSGLGNIRSSPADPSRNIDWVLLSAQVALTVAGCFIVFSATRVRTADPYTFVTRQVIFAIVAAVAMVVVMAVDYEWWKDRARALYVLTIAVLVRARRRTAGVAGDDRCWRSTSARSRSSRPSSPSSSCCWRCAPTSATSAAESVSYPRFLGALIIVGIPAVLDHHPARPRHRGRC